MKPLWLPQTHKSIDQMLDLFVRQSGFTLEQLRERNQTMERIRARRIVAKKMFSERFTKAQIGRFLQRDATVITDYLRNLGRSVRTTMGERAEA